MRQEDRASIAGFVVLLVACLLGLGTASTCEVNMNVFRGQGDGPHNPHASCQKYCDVKEGIFRSGENWTDANQPCLQYHCDRGKVIVSKVKCEDISTCADGLPPYYIPGECCLHCDLMQHSKVPSLVLSEWSPWTVCSTSCGPGKRSRSRSCSPHPDSTDPSSRASSVQCQGHLHEVEHCLQSHCAATQ